MGKRKADAPPQLDLAPEVGDIGFVASAHPSKETTTCESVGTRKHQSIRIDGFW